MTPTLPHDETPQDASVRALAESTFLTCVAHSPRRRSPPQEALIKALALNGTEIDSRAISVERALPRGARPAKGAAPKATAETPDATEKPAAAGEGGEDGGDAEGANKKGKKKKKKKAEGEVVVFGAGSGGGGGGIKWPVHPTTVFVRGLGMSATSADLREAFVGAGAVLEARVVEDKKTRETKVRVRYGHFSSVADDLVSRSAVFFRAGCRRKRTDRRYVVLRNCRLGMHSVFFFC